MSNPSNSNIIATPSANNQVVSKALLRVAENLGLKKKDISQIIGISPSTVSRLYQGTHMISADSKEGELALLLIRIYRSLDAILGGHDEQNKKWLYHFNDYFSAVPFELITSAQGLVNVANYLDAIRGKV